MRVLIIGGGVIGLSIGWQLLRHHFSVEIFERNEFGKEASWTAAGMLAPYSEALNEVLGELSLSQYPQFLQELNEDTTDQLTFEKNGTLFVGLNRDDRSFLEHRFQNLPIAWLTGKEAREKEPLLSPRVTMAAWIETETHLSNRKLLIHLKEAFCRRGGVLHENCAVESLWIEKGNVKGVLTEQPIEGKFVINAAGAWADLIRKETSEQIYPNKGQILTLSMPKNMTLGPMIRTPRVYLVPKSDGFLRIGATDELMGFDKSTTVGAILLLLQQAFEVVPAIAEMQFCEAEASLRPASSNHLPSIEETELKGYFRAVGHGRSGILLAPYTAYKTVRALCKYV